jgi:DUF2892 family protein
VTTNMGTADRAIRTLVAVAIAVLYFTGRISGTIRHCSWSRGGHLLGHELRRLVSRLPPIRLVHSEDHPGGPRHLTTGILLAEVATLDWLPSVLPAR